MGSEMCIRDRISPARLSGEGCLGAFEFPALLDCFENVCLACCTEPGVVKFFFFCLLRLAPRIWFGNPLGMRPMAWRSTQLTSISSCMWGEMIASTRVSTPWELVMMRACPSTCICSPFAASRMMYWSSLGVMLSLLATLLDTTVLVQPVSGVAPTLRVALE